MTNDLSKLASIYIDTEKSIISIFENIFIDLFKLKKYNDRIEIKIIYVSEEYQSDCDGDDEYVYLDINLSLINENSKDLFLEYIKKISNYDYSIYSVKYGEILSGDTYKFKLKYYTKQQ